MTSMLAKWLGPVSFLSEKNWYRVLKEVIANSSWFWISPNLESHLGKIHLIQTRQYKVFNRFNNTGPERYYYTDWGPVDLPAYSSLNCIIISCNHFRSWKSWLESNFVDVHKIISLVTWQKIILLVKLNYLWLNLDFSSSFQINKFGGDSVAGDVKWLISCYLGSGKRCWAYGNTSLPDKQPKVRPRSHTAAQILDLRGQVNSQRLVQLHDKTFDILKNTNRRHLKAHPWGRDIVCHLWV